MNAYPPLKALIAFDAAMRNNSFSVAAEELCVTPGAVGQQVQKLEEWLGTPLFTRHIRQVQPTADAFAYWQRIRPALAQIADASRSLKHSRSLEVRVSMPPSFAAKWFTRRMVRFLTRHPDVALHLDSSAALVDFEREPVDLAIRHFSGNAAQLQSTLLYQDEARVYCSPAYAAALGLTKPEDLARATLLHTTVQPHWLRWPEWLRRFSSLDETRIGEIPGLHFDQALLAIEAARQGQGVVMTSPMLTETETAEGSLIEPFPHRLPSAAGYYVVHPVKASLRPAAAALKAWLIEEAGAPE